MSASLVGSEMCIRDRARHAAMWARERRRADGRVLDGPCRAHPHGAFLGCLLYTSDAADDM
eukprot:7112576-Alexandrium_andersonii.AAC.1